MADTAAEIPISIEESVIETVKNATEKVPATIEGLAIAYFSLVIMAILPIFFGSFRSVKYLKEQKESGTPHETMSNRDALMFPLIASCALFGLYVFFQFFSKEYINLLLTGYFFFLGVLALSHLLSPVISFMVPASIPNVSYHIHFTRDSREDIINYKFTSYDVICLLISLCLGAWYLFKKHWIANNLFGIAFAINGVELLHLNNVVTGCILLCGLFLYDIFWVFGTNVMVTVAKSFEAPIKLVFPQDLLVNGLSASNFAMLGLGDIVVPGIFIALLLRFDRSLKRNSDFYFRATFLAYIVGLLGTILVMHVFRHAQPALLYLVPACLGTPLLLALLRGDLAALFRYEDQPSVPAEAVDDKKKEQESGTPHETMSNRDALMFPLIASCALFGLYVFFQFFSKEYINLLLTGYFFFLGVLALSHLLSPVISFMVPASIPNVSYHIHFTRDSREDIINYKFTSYDVICLLISLCLGAWYLFKKHWIANNLFGIAFAINGVELLHLNNVVTGCILLCGLFLYDIFWVFGTNVMVTVAKSFEAPIKLVFPQDLLVNGLSASNFAMLGLGDIVVPGIFIALLLRFDRSLKRNSDFYFRATFLAYIVGLLGTILVMHVFRHAQPALLYLVPACLGTPLLLALLRGDLAALFRYEDQPSVPAEAVDDKKKE